jgi:hypothetical protein
VATTDFSEFFGEAEIGSLHGPRSEALLLWAIPAR